MSNNSKFPSFDEMCKGLDEFREGNAEHTTKNLFSFHDVITVMDNVMSGPCKVLMSKEEYTCFAYACIDKLMEVGIKKLLVQAVEISNEILEERYGKH